MMESFAKQVTEQEIFSDLLGPDESETGESTFGVVLEFLLPSYKEVLTPKALPTYLGSTLLITPTTNIGLGPVEGTSTSLDKDNTWSRGHGFEHSLIKTRSSHLKEGFPPIHPVDPPHTYTYIGALRGMKALARAKP
jgi:hypothetical protein